jgi:hypothetical protein
MQQAPTKPPVQAPTTPAPRRPFGLTGLAVLAIVAGIIELLVSFSDYSKVGLFGSGAGAIFSGNVSGSQAVSLGLATALLVLAVLYIVFALGALGMRPWAWGLGITLSILAVIDTGANAIFKGLNLADVLTVVIAILVLVYLYSGHVRSAFGGK